MLYSFPIITSFNDTPNITLKSSLALQSTRLAWWYTTCITGFLIRFTVSPCVYWKYYVRQPSSKTLWDVIYSLPITIFNILFTTFNVSYYVFAQWLRHCIIASSLFYNVRGTKLDKAGRSATVLIRFLFSSRLFNWLFLSLQASKRSNEKDCLMNSNEVFPKRFTQCISGEKIFGSLHESFHKTIFPSFTT